MSKYYVKPQRDLERKVSTFDVVRDEDDRVIATTYTVNDADLLMNVLDATDVHPFFIGKIEQ